MSGHSKWSQIKHKKALTDAKKGQVFGKLARAISVAARDNPDVRTNLRLKAAVDQARAMNMPSENVERAIKRVSDRSQAVLDEIVLELVASGGTAVIVTGITDNRNRTLGELRTIATRYGARPAGEGSLLWQFKRTGVIRVAEGLSTPDSETLELKAIDAGASDITQDANGITILTPPEMLYTVRNAIASHGTLLSVGLEYLPLNAVPATDDVRSQLQHLTEALDDLDDVQDVFTNVADL